MAVWDHFKMLRVAGKLGEMKKEKEERGRDVAPQFFFWFFFTTSLYITLSSPDQTNVTSDTETPNINTKRHLEQIKDAGTRRGPIKNDDEKHKETHLFIFKSVQRCEVVTVFSCQMRHFFFPPFLLVFHGCFWD